MAVLGGLARANVLSENFHATRTVRYYDVVPILKTRKNAFYVLYVSIVLVIASSELP